MRINEQKQLILSVLLLILFSCSAYSQRGKTYISLQEALKNPEDVYILDLSKRTYGTLSPDVGKLVNLEELYLEKNGLNSLPKEIGNLKMLTILDVDQNSLRSIPAEIGNLTNLVELDIDQNYIRELPPEIGNLIHLESFDLHSNQIRKIPPEIGKLTKLKDINLVANNIDTLPPEFNNLVNLSSLVLSKVKYISAIGNLQKLTSLSFYECGLTALPPDIGKLKNLKTLKVFGNPVTSLPEGIGELTSLTELDLQFNQIGSIPAEIGKLTSLTNLYLNNNKIKSLPPEIGKLTQLKQLRIANNLLDSLPKETGDLTELIVLEVNGNKLKTFPAELSKLKKIKAFNFSKNEIAKFPSGIGKFSQLEYLNLSENKLTEIPVEFCELVNISSLYLDHNALTKLPAEIGKMKALRFIYVNHNKLTELPPQIGDLEKLEYLSVFNNSISVFPAEIGKLGNLTVLIANDNRISVLPAEIGNLKHLYTLHLENNKLTGLPSEFGNLANLNEIILNNNRLVSLPESFGKLSELTELEITKNLLKSLPKSFADLYSLQKLDISGNPFLSTLTPIGKIESLSVLKLSQKHLALLPVEILNHKELEYVTVTDKDDELVDLSYLTDLLVNNTNKTAAQKKQLRKDLWMDKVLTEIENRESIKCLECTGTKENALLYGLIYSATDEELLEMLEGEDKHLRAYAFKALEKKNYKGMYSLILKHLFDEEGLNHSSEEWVSLGDMAATSPALTPKQKAEVDSILLYTVNNIATTRLIIEQLEPEERYHDRIAQLTAKYPEALLQLVKYKRPEDVKIIEQGILNAPDYTEKIITQFPHPYFKNTIEILKSKKRFYMNDYADAIAVYRDSFALKEFTEAINVTTYKYDKPAILSAMAKYPCPLYNDLMFLLAEEYPEEMSENLFNYLKSVDLLRTTKIAQKNLKELHRFLSDYEIEMYMDHLLYFSFDSLQTIFVEIIHEAETERIALENKSYPMDNDYRNYWNVYNNRYLFTDYNKKYVKLSFFLGQAKRFKSDTVAKSLLSYLRNTGDGETEISKIILAYNEPEHIRELITIIGQKRFIIPWHADEIKKEFEKSDWLDEIAASTKLFPDDYTGSWKILSYTDSSGKIHSVPWFGKLEINNDYRVQHCYFWNIGYLSKTDSMTIKFVPSDKSETMYINTMLATSAGPEIHNLCDWYDYKGADSLMYANYEKNMDRMISSTTKFQVKDSSMVLSGNGVEIKLKLEDSWYTDWRKKKIKVTNVEADLPYIEIPIVPDTGKVIKYKPQTIAGKPVSYFLSHPGIDKNSKLFIQGKLSINDHENGWEDKLSVKAMIDSLNTKNPETFPYYIYQFHRILDVASGRDYYYYNVLNWINYACVKFFLDDPCRFFTFIKYGEYKKYLMTWQHQLRGSLWEEKSEELMKEGIKYKLGNDCPAYVKDWDKLIEWMENYQEPDAGRG